MEGAFMFVSLCDLPLLPFPYDGLHFLGFDVLIALPLGNAKPVLTSAVMQSVRHPASPEMVRTQL
jgi:hypothetical protein